MVVSFPRGRVWAIDDIIGGNGGEGTARAALGGQYLAPVREGGGPVKCRYRRRLVA